jgi:hypothetical protein
MLYCSPRANGRLIDIGGEAAIREHRPLEWTDLSAAFQTEDFAPFRKEAALLNSPSPIDEDTHPELSSANTTSRRQVAHEAKRKASDLELAASLALQSQQTPSEAQDDQAFKFATLQESGKLPPNTASLAARRNRSKRPNTTIDDMLRDSMYTKHTSRNGNQFDSDPDSSGK